MQQNHGDNNNCGDTDENDYGKTTVTQITQKPWWFAIYVAIILNDIAEMKTFTIQN